ARGTRVLRL
ncbi:unnamed protein product, partial [Cuscuta campestris]